MVNSFGQYVLLGIPGAKGAPLPRLCFAQLALTLFIATVFAIKALCYGQTDGRTQTTTNI